MNEAILNYTSHLYGHVVLIVATTAALLLAMLIDLISGVQKARSRGEATTSQGFKKTCEKARKYFGPYIVLICIDLLACVLIPAPAFSMLWAASASSASLRAYAKRAGKKKNCVRPKRL